ncbi:MAG: dephospho-CoA kinase [Clostridia bacterium]|nr:dephospho-CoA kinase [Clostridia bacterium]
MKNQLNKAKIAITGGIGSGKSQAAKFIKALGFSVFSCDEIYKNVILSREYIEQVEKAFPESVVNKQIDRKILADIVFNDAQRRQTLNNIAHPLIMERLFRDMDDAPMELVFAEVPLLFEGNYQELFDFVIVIERDIAKRIESVKTRDGLSDEQILNRIQSQFDYSKIKETEYFKNGKIIEIDNNGGVEDLNEKVSLEINRLKSLM